MHKPVLLGIDDSDLGSIPVQISVDHCSHRRQLCQQIHRVLVRILPVRLNKSLSILKMIISDK